MNLANKITVVRIFLVPVIMFFLLVNLNLPAIRMPEINGTDIHHYIQSDYCRIHIQYCSDYRYADGYIARKHKLVSNLGKLLDPLADKLLVAAVLISLVEMDKLDALIAIIIISREFAVTGLKTGCTS